MAQTKDDLEDFYETFDPWEYRETPDDWERRNFIATIAYMFYDHYHRILDIGAGEGFVTELFEADDDLHAIELSDKAASRMDKKITRVKKPEGDYDLVLACGVLYEHYDHGKLIDWIDTYATGIVITCHYDQMEEVEIGGPTIFYAEWPYREGKQRLRVYDYTHSA